MRASPGLSPAYWLTRYGFEVTVVERAAALRPGGQAVDFRGEVHLSVLERMGILDEIRRRQTGNGALRLIDAAGRDLVALPASFTGGEVEILRGDLAQLLFERTKDTATYLFDDSVTSLTETGHGVRVTFERAAPADFDRVIGADGLHSSVRRLAFGGDSRFVEDSGYHVAIFSAPCDLADDVADQYPASDHGGSYPLALSTALTDSVRRRERPHPHRPAAVVPAGGCPTR